MIIVSRLNGERFGVNADHIERIEEMPDTVLTLADGTKYIVRESLEDVLEKIVGYRAEILRVSYSPAETTTVPVVPLQIVDDETDRPENHTFGRSSRRDG